MSKSTSLKLPWQIHLLAAAHVHNLYVIAYPAELVQRVAALSLILVLVVLDAGGDLLDL